MQLFAASPRKPDFAFPKTVIANSEKSLEQALKKGDDVGAIRAAINMTLAQNEIDSDSMPASIDRLGELAKRFSTPAPKAVTDLLLARIYADYYQSQQWTIDARSVEGSPTDWSEWNRAQFVARVTELLNSAMSSPEALVSTPLRSYDSLLDIPASRASIEYMFYPSLLDFVGGQAIDILSHFNTQETQALAGEYRQTLIRLNSSHPAPLIINEIEDVTASAPTGSASEEALLEIYRRHESTAFSGEALIAYSSCVNTDDISTARELKTLIEGFISRYPTYVRINNLKNTLTEITKGRALVETPDVVVPGDYLRVTASIRNLNGLKVGIYRLPQSADADNSYHLPSGIVTPNLRKIGELNFTFTGTLPFADTSTDSLRIPEPGLYIAVAEAPGLSRDSYYDIIRATSMTIGELGAAGDDLAFVTDPLTGAPVGGAEMFCITRQARQQTQKSVLGTTDADGMMKLPKDRRGLLHAVKGSDIFAKTLTLRNFGSEVVKSARFFIKIYTDLPLYRPGDEVTFAAMAYSVKEREAAARSGLTMQVTLRDANWQEVDTLTLTTDSYGRATGSFTLPDDGRLNGIYSINVKGGNTSESTYFMVSDYKLPSFEVKVTATENDIPARGDVTLRGRATTFSGMPVADAGVEVRIDRRYFWRFTPASAAWAPISLSATTDDKGYWSVTIPASDLAKGGENAWYNAAVTVTSLAGESQATSRVFTLGPGIRIEARLSDSYNISRPVKLPVNVVDTRDNALDSVMVNFTAALSTDRDKTLLSGSFLSGNPVADLSSLRPGNYTFTFSTADADTVITDGIFLYNPAIDRSPSADLLWSPDRIITLGPDNSAQVLLGTSMDTTYVLYTLYDYEKVIERRWMTLPAGLHTIDISTIHGGEPDLRASFIATGRYTSSRINVEIKPAIDPRKLSIKAEAMRDRLSPGTEEVWKFSVVNASGTPVEAAVMADMYNSALDVLAPGLWTKPAVYFPSISLRWSFSGSAITRSYLQSIGNKDLKTVNFYLPQWQLYGRGFAPQTFRAIHIRGTKMAANLAYKAEYDMADDAEMVLEEAAVTESAMAGAAPAPSPAAAAGINQDMGEGASEENAGAANEPADIEYRALETPLALFRPILSTGPDGRLELRFTIPNANARWQFQALAWTDDMRIAQFDASVVASKPVMVKLNAPRFLRQGDRSIVPATVMNASDSEQSIEATIETFNPLTDKVIASTTKRLTIAPQSSAIIDIMAEALPELSMLGFRAKASTATFADGEQTALAILPAATPVIDSEPFYMGPDTETATIVMPGEKDASEAVTTLEYCANPAWYVVTALPGLRQADPTSATEAADALFSAAVARGLINRYPAIADALREWTASGSSAEAITPMLNKNEDLKNLLLAATPWMMDARSDALRMQRLALLFDSGAISRSINGAIALLSRLERPGGGWAWIERVDEPSEWATNSVLTTIATLDQYGFTPDDDKLRKMTASAIAFIDAEAARRADKYPKDPQVAYTSLRSSFPAVKASSSAEKIMAMATQAVVSDWKSYSLNNLPQAALMLWRRDYKSVAAQILESMRQYMVTTPEKGTFFPSLQNQAWGYLIYTADALKAFATITPGAPEVDGLRHWLVVQKQATDWGSSPGATDVVAAILTSSQSWLTTAPETRVKINGSSIRLPSTDRRLGYFRIPVNVRKPSDDISVAIEKLGSTPAWGAVMRRAVAPLTSIEAASTDDISIEKRIVGADDLALGQKITVALTIHVNRNLNYVTITDDRAACFEPVNQLPSSQWSEGICFYLEPRDSRTSIFVTTMPKGTYVVTYDLYVNNAGSFASGIATIQSQYAPEITARSAGSLLTVKSPDKQ